MTTEQAGITKRITQLTARLDEVSIPHYRLLRRWETVDFNEWPTGVRQQLAAEETEMKQLSDQIDALLANYAAESGNPDLYRGRIDRLADYSG